MENRHTKNKTVSTRSEFCLGLILKLAALCRVTLDESTQIAFLERLIGFPEESLRVAFQKAGDEWDRPSMFPPMKFILDRIPEQNHRLQAEQSWELVQRILNKHWHPDIGFYSNRPTLDGATEYAIRQCGGLLRINNTPEENFSFIRRDFIAAHQRFSEEGGEQTHMSQQLAEKTLRQIQEMRKQLESGDDIA